MRLHVRAVPAQQSSTSIDSNLIDSKKGKKKNSCRNRRTRARWTPKVTLRSLGVVSSGRLKRLSYFVRELSFGVSKAVNFCVSIRSFSKCDWQVRLKPIKAFINSLKVEKSNKQYKLYTTIQILWHHLLFKTVVQPATSKHVAILPGT